MDDRRDIVRSHCVERLDGFFVKYHLHHSPGLPYDLHRGGTELKSAWFL